MTEQKTTMPEKAFLESLDALENLAKGMVPVADDLDAAAGEDLEKSQSADGQGEAAADEALVKGDDGGDDEDEDKDEGDEDAEKALSGDALSFAEEAAAGSENIRKAIEVSDFLADLVDRVGDAIDGIRKNLDSRVEAIEKSLLTVCEANQSVVQAVAETLRKSFQAVSEKTDQQAETLRKSLDILNDELSRTPARAPKAKVSVLEKGFNDEEKGIEMSKADILKSLSDMFERGEPGVTSLDVIRFESSGVLPPHIQKKFQSR